MVSSTGHATVGSIDSSVCQSRLVIPFASSFLSHLSRNLCLCSFSPYLALLPQSQVALSEQRSPLSARHLNVNLLPVLCLWLTILCLSALCCSLELRLCCGLLYAWVQFWLFTFLLSLCSFFFSRFSIAISSQSWIVWLQWKHTRLLANKQQIRELSINE